MSTDRVFRSSDFLQPADGEPIRSVIAQSPEAAVIAWFVKPGQRISAHTHPYGQDTWTVLSGRGAYQLDAGGQSRAIAAGDVAVAPKGCVHGVFNDGTEPLVFVSVVCPAESGYELL